MVKPVVQVINLGRSSFSAAYQAQCSARDKLIKQLNSVSSCLSPSTSSPVSSGSSVVSSSSNLMVNRFENKLFLVEHDPVYTIGIRRSDYDEKLIDSLKSLGADFVITDRGGLITFHGYGQLTVYPVLYLGCFFKNKSIRCYVHRLEDTVISTCCKVLPNERKVSTITEYPGVWIENDRKIAAIGIHGRRYITTHGTCINCNNDLSWFDNIIPCGIKGKQVTSITKEIGINFTIEQAIPLFLESFAEKFNCDLK